MGAVFLATSADKEFEKHVAVKIIKRGMDTDAVLERFRNERQILASLKHPNIARLHDGGTTANDLPYFVMKYIAGLPITKYAAKYDLSVKERLELFQKVCAAAAFAHQRLIIHRDIKSSNVIVTADGTPKLPDFGIAKLTTPNAFEKDQTETGFRLMTPEYASPEQIRGENVTTATDIYSLGVVLFELLTGKRPFDRQFRDLNSLYKAVCETEPSKPSVAVGPASEAQSLKFENETFENKKQRMKDERQRTNPKYLRGDIDNIVLKSLAKEPASRYLTVEQFSEDIRAASRRSAGDGTTFDR